MDPQHCKILILYLTRGAKKNNWTLVSELNEEVDILNSGNPSDQHLVRRTIEVINSLTTGNPSLPIWGLGGTGSKSTSLSEEGSNH
jgi:hypothetical protein